ncbi:Common central domain of tyrosinase [Halocaridina rubra]|uniref:Common central domain of tyrosinase n=1 Tax=Halocaridina rubra TaxID=373956 RepID=A0AAN8X9W9_HALRR
MANPDQKAILDLFARPYNATATTTFEVGTRMGAVPTAPTSDPTIGTATTIPRGKPFCIFARSHRRAARDLCSYFMRANRPSELAQMAGRVRTRLNENLFVYALSFAIMRKPSLRTVGIPSVVEVFPNKFVGQDVIMEAQAQVNMRPPGQMDPIIINQEFTGTLLKPEHRVSYWREDYGMNVHHWHWHLVFPVEMELNRDRKGEVFYYMHEQMLARYDMERLSVNLNRVVPLNNWRVPIPDGYFSKLTVNNSGRNWGTRQDNTLLQDLRRDDFGFGPIYISEFETWYNRLLDAIHQGFMIDKQGNRIPLSDDVPYKGKLGIEIIADAFEADADLSINYPFYGDYHNLAHFVIASAHDPDFAHREEIGAIGDPTTSMRDPAFYRLHKFVDLLFEEYKEQQAPYPVNDLNFEGIRIDRAGVSSGNEVNHLRTGWNEREFEATRGLDFNSEVPIRLRFTHLDHRPFQYHIQITNSNAGNKDVTVRIYLAPTRDEKGDTMSFMDQRLLWAEMDKFTVTLRPGPNQLSRASTESSITAPPELTFRELETGTLEYGTDIASRFGACGCGWPQHMLVPRGNRNGMDFQLFFLITDWEKDKVEQPPNTGNQCRNAASFCGILDARYPDRRPMGFPFDRRPPEVIGNTTIQTAQNFAESLGNALIVDIKITYQNGRLTPQ